VCDVGAVDDTTPRGEELGIRAAAVSVAIKTSKRNRRPTSEERDAVITLLFGGSRELLFTGTVVLSFCYPTTILGSPGLQGGEEPSGNVLRLIQIRLTTLVLKKFGQVSRQFAVS
jgi:hypothetical protein